MDAPEPNDWTLLQEWRDGDRKAGDTLVQRHFSAVSRFFRTKVGDDVDDLVQQTFLACVEGVDRIQGDSFRAYLFGTARRRLLDRFRKAHRGPDPVDLSVNSLVDLGTSPSQTLARAEGHQLLSMAVATLPVDSQIALELAYWEGLSGAEMAAVLEIPENTVRSRLARARARLREAMQLLQPANIDKG